MASLALPIISGLGSLFGGLFGASGANKAAQQQVQAEQQAQGQLEQTQGQVMGALQPYQNLGLQGASTMGQMLPSLVQPWTQTFQAPTAAQAQQMPGYQFQLQQGLNAVQNSAAARGGLLSGGTMADLNNYAQGMASTDYNNLFQQALQGYQTNYGTFTGNQNNIYSKLMGTTGLGLGAGNTMANLATGIGGDIASLYGSQGQARASGTLGASNAYSNMFGNLSSTANQAMMMSQLNPNNWNTSAPSTAPWGSGGSAPWGAAPWMQPNASDPWMNPFNTANAPMSQMVQ